MTPAAFVQNETARDAFGAARRGEGALRAGRGSRRVSFNLIGDAQAPLFHAWRP